MDMVVGFHSLLCPLTRNVCAEETIRRPACFRGLLFYPISLEKPGKELDHASVHASVHASGPCGIPYSYPPNQSWEAPISQISRSLKLEAGKVAGSGKAMGDDALDVDVGFLRGRPQLDEDELASTAHIADAC